MINDALFILWDSSDADYDELRTKYSSSVHRPENDIFLRICEISKSHCRIQHFIETFGCNKKPILTNVQQMCGGLYTQALSEGLDEILEPYRSTLVDLETEMMENPNLTISYIAGNIDKYKGLFNVLNRIIMSIKERRLRGCQIPSIVYQFLLSGDSEIHKSMLKLFSYVNHIFYNQLCSWVLYGELNDPFQEFIIQKHYKGVNNISSDTIPSSPSTLHRTNASDKPINYEYAINSQMLPYFLPLSLAQDMLFVGNTVNLFSYDPRTTSKGSCMYSNEFIQLHKSDVKTRRFTIWDDKETEFNEKIQSLKKSEVFDINKFASVLKEIKACVTKHLWVVVVKEGQLMHELQLIKDFFLLGRGELFLELLRLTEHMLNEPSTQISTRAMNQAFHVAARAVHLGNSSDIDKFSFELPYTRINSTYEASSSVHESEEGWSTIILKYNFKWPLHLLFTPEVLARYNDMFRLLLRIKNTQHNLHLLWKTFKLSNGSSICQLHTKLMFLMDNLQHYLQADVLESNFSKLKSVTEKMNDFEQLKRAHATFLADVLSQSFLFVKQPGEESVESNDSADNLNNPVFCDIIELLRLCDAFCNMTTMSYDSSQEDLCESNQYHMIGLTERFETLVTKLLQLLTALRLQLCGTYLARLLMRLDYNRWFSSTAHLTQSVTNYDRSNNFVGNIEDEIPQNDLVFTVEWPPDSLYSSVTSKSVSPDLNKYKQNWCDP